MTTAERWLPVPNYPGYEVSDQGGVRSIDRQVRSRWGSPKTLRGKTLSQTKIGGGSGDGGRYWGCVLYRDGKRRQVATHIVVLEAFVGPRPPGNNGLHRDDDPNHNYVANLYWGTPRQNVADAIASGRHHTVRLAAQTHCPAGHEYTEANTYRRPRTGHRECRHCHRDRVKAYFRKQAS